ncbi:hypothetical protein BGS_0443 [Beggiatoa sp. SS]|nr:hypothetical protein BGS_0443 [Beggiatoa sp. SS]
MNRQAGFTLLEIAIVVVIIGLLLGAVLNGREIILNAKIKQLENDYKGVSAAIYTYPRSLWCIARGMINGQPKNFHSSLSHNTLEPG